MYVSILFYVSPCFIEGQYFFTVMNVWL